MKKQYLTLLILLLFILELGIECSRESRRQRKEKKEEKKRQEKEAQERQRAEQEAKFASQEITKRPNFISPELWCNTCEGIIRTIIPKLKDKRSESDIIIVMQKTCRLVNFQNYDFQPQEMKASCEYFWGEWEEILERELQYRRNNESFEKDFCHQKTKACQGILTGNERFKAEDVTDQFKEKTMDANFTTRDISPDELQMRDITEEYKARMRGEIIDPPLTPKQQRQLEKRRKKWERRQNNPGFGSESDQFESSSDDDSSVNEEESSETESEEQQKSNDYFDYQAKRNKERQQQYQEQKEQQQDEENIYLDENNLPKQTEEEINQNNNSKQQNEKKNNQKIEL